MKERKKQKLHVLVFVVIISWPSSFIDFAFMTALASIHILMEHLLSHCCSYWIMDRRFKLTLHWMWLHGCHCINFLLNIFDLLWIMNSLWTFQVCVNLNFCETSSNGKNKTKSAKSISQCQGWIFTANIISSLIFCLTHFSLQLFRTSSENMDSK